jgi:O-antigen ligase
VEAHNIFVEMVAEHGFVGLGLFCLLIIATYRSCAVIQKRVRGRDELVWAADLARATQVGLVAFIVGGSFVSIANTPFLYMLASITVGTRSLVERDLASSVPSQTSAAPARQIHAAVSGGGTD